MKALGIDLGTTKVAAVIYDKNTGLEAVASQPHNAAENNSDSTIFEQDVSKITHCVDQLISMLPEKLLAETVNIYYYDAKGAKGHAFMLA